MLQVYLSVTEQCNLACPFCFWNEKPTGRVGAFDRKAVVDSLSRLLEDNAEATVVFYGGEPTLYADRIRDIIEEVASSGHGHGVRFALQTNGTKIASVLEMLDRFWYLSVSINEYTRDSIDSAALAYASQRLPVIGRLTYTGTSLRPFIEWAGSRISHIYWQLVNARQITFPLDLYRKHLAEVIACAESRPHVRFVPLEYAHEYLQAPRLQDDGWYACGVGKWLRYIDPLGNYHWCDEFAGHSNSDETWVSVPPKCHSCNIWGFCRGRCAAVLAKYGPGSFFQYCPFTAALLDLVRDHGYTGHGLDAVSLQTEVLP